MAKAKKNLPKISVITPSFNQGHFIKETIDSVLNQDYPNLEYIVMDGGSTDETVKILKSYGKKLTWVSQKDRGQADAINKGVKKSSGEIVMYINSDDVMLPGTLKLVGERFAADESLMWLTGGYEIIDESGREIQSFVSFYKRMLRSFPTFKLLSIANYIIQPSTFWRRALMDENGFFDKDLHLCMDYDFWMRAIKKYPLKVVDQKLSQFRIHGDSKGLSQYKKQFREESEVLSRYTNNAILKMLHKIHAELIIVAYNLIK